MDGIFQKQFDFLKESLHANDQEERERLQQAAKEEGQKCPDSWLQLETEKNRSFLDFFLGRCCLVLSAVVKLKNGPNHMIQNGGLSVLSSCMDVPIGDTHHSALTGIGNVISTLGMKAILPTECYDPAHLIRAIAIGLDRLVMSGDTSPIGGHWLLTAGQLKGSPEWLPYFQLLPTYYKILAEQMIHPIIVDRSCEPPPDEDLWKDTCNMKFGISERCLSYSGKLRSCNACGKLETKRGSMSTCSGCYQVVYCSREVRSLCFVNCL